MTHLRVHIHGMDCAEEAALVRRALAPLAATSLDFDLVHGVVDITFDEAVTTERALLDAIDRTGLAAHAVRGDEGHRVVQAEHHDHDHRTHRSTLATALSLTLFVAAWIREGLDAESWVDVFVHRHEHATPAAAIWLYGLSAFAGLWPLWPRALAALRHLRLDMHALVCVTVIGAAVIGEWSEGAAVALLFGLAHRLEGWSLDRARREIAALVARGPALVAQGSDRPSLAHQASNSAFHGWGGSGGDTEQWIERFAAVYTPLVVGAAVVLSIVPPLVLGEPWAVWFYRALLFLVLACPCALVVSTPVTMVAALSAAAQHGVLVKGGAVLERAARATAPTREGLAATGIVVASAASGDPASADVVLTASNEQAIALLVRLARRALGVVRQNVAIALVTKAAFLVSAPLGFAPLWLAVLADTGATVIVTLNGLRLLSVGRTKSEGVRS